MWLIVAAGTASVLYAAFTLPTGVIDGYFLLLTLITAVLVRESRFAFQRSAATSLSTTLSSSLLCCFTVVKLP